MTPSLDESVVRHVAHLARLKIPDAEAALYAAQLSRILDYFQQLEELDTRDVPPTAHPLPVSNVFRDDVIRPSWTVEDAMLNAPDNERGFFKVPKVLEQESS